MTHQKIALAALLASLFGPALADDAPVRVEPNPGPAMLLHRETIKNAPYSAEMVTERVQNLADGNQIDQRSAVMRYRDSAGRTREEIRTEGGHTVVTINDPVAGQTLVLNPESRTAVKVAGAGQSALMAREAGRAAAEAARARVEQMRKDGLLPTVERHKRADGSEEIIVKRVERMDDKARERIQQDVRIQASQALAANAGALRNLQIQLAPLTHGAFGDAQWSARATTKDLGAREFDGVKAEGKLRSYEIPAGAIGNRNPIVVSDETWYAPELQITVYTKHSDPRSGDFVFRLDKLRRAEPPAALFTVPADYTVTDPLAQARTWAANKAR